MLAQTADSHNSTPAAGWCWQMAGSPDCWKTELNRRYRETLCLFLYPVLWRLLDTACSFGAVDAFVVSRPGMAGRISCWAEQCSFPLRS